MPVVVAPDAFDLWLDHRKVDAETAATLIAPAREGCSEPHPVSRRRSIDAGSTTVRELDRAGGESRTSGKRAERSAQSGRPKQRRTAKNVD